MLEREGLHFLSGRIDIDDAYGGDERLNKMPFAAVKTAEDSR